MQGMLHIGFAVAFILIGNFSPITHFYSPHSFLHCSFEIRLLTSIRSWKKIQAHDMYTIATCLFGKSSDHNTSKTSITFRFRGREFIHSIIVPIPSASIRFLRHRFPLVVGKDATLIAENVFHER